MKTSIINYNVKNVIKCLIIMSIFTMLTACSKNAQYYYEAAVVQLDNKDYEAADKFIQSALKQEPDKVEYLLCSGLIDIGRKEYKKAVESFEKSTTTDGNENAKENNKNAYRGLGIAYICLEEYDKSIESFDKALELDVLQEINYDIYKYKADAMMRNKDYEKALAVCDLIINESKDDVNGYIQKCVCLLELGKYEEIETYLEKVEKLSKDDSYKAQAYSEITTALINSKQYDKVLEMIKKVPDTKNKDAKKVLLKNEIVCYEKKGDFKTAREKAEAYLKAYPNDSEMANEVKFLKTRVSDN